MEYTIEALGSEERGLAGHETSYWLFRVSWDGGPPEPYHVKDAGHEGLDQAEATARLAAMLDAEAEERELAALVGQEV
jgi:hypothetical protein